MALEINQLMYDSKQNRANVVLIGATGNGDMLQISFPMTTTGSETQNQVNDMLKAKAKALAAEAASLLT